MLAAPLLKASTPADGTVTIGTGPGKYAYSILASQLAGATTATAAAATGRVAVHDINITKKVDQSSPKLFAACATGKHFNTVTITLLKAGGKALQTTLHSVVISSDQHQQSAGGNAVPLEQISLNFTKIEFKYVQQ